MARLYVKVDMHYTFYTILKQPSISDMKIYRLALRRGRNRAGS